VTTAKITSKGQITIPKKVRDALGLSQGEEIEFIRKGAGYSIRRVPKSSVFEKWAGYLGGNRRRTDEVIKELRDGDNGD